MNTSRLRMLYREAKTNAKHAMLAQIVSHAPFRLVVFSGMKRSGNHVALNWFTQQNPGTSLLFNNVHPNELPTERHRQEINFGSPFKAITAIASYEDRLPDEILGGGLAKFREAHASRIRTTDLCVILRDPQNLLASRLKKWPEEFESAERLEALIACYLDHHRVALEQQVLQGVRITPIFYNAFVVSRPYRDLISSRLGINFGDRGLDEVPNYGHGSSFDGMGKQGRAAEMDVFSRWTLVADDPRFVRAMADPRIQAARDVFEAAVADRLQDAEKRVQSA